LPRNGGREAAAARQYPGEALTFSLLWRSARGAGALSGLTLAAGVAIARALESAGAKGVALKWPNDVLWRGGKLAGVLSELQGDALGPTAVVIGIGINVRLSDATRSRIGQAAADLDTACGSAPTEGWRLRELDRVLEVFGRDGFAPLRAEWQQRHAHQDKRVTLMLSDGARRNGHARGVADDGALLLETTSGTQRFHSGEITLRAQRQ
jgi:BirA family biotin operon repressor/biotin-[acetyl-CoA-carboxylase] ligase